MERIRQTGSVNVLYPLLTVMMLIDATESFLK